MRKIVTSLPISDGWKRKGPSLTQPVMPLAAEARPGILGEIMMMTSMTSSHVDMPARER